MARNSLHNDTQMATEAFRELVGWFPRSGKAAEKLWVQHQGLLADAEKIAQRKQAVDVIFLQAGDLFLARVKNLNVEVLQTSWISECLDEGKLASVAPFRLTDPPQAFPARTLPPSPRSQPAHADDAENSDSIKEIIHTNEIEAEVEPSRSEAQQSAAIESFSPISQSGFTTGLFASSMAPAVIKIESPPLSLPYANTDPLAESTIQIIPEDTDVKVMTVASAPSVPTKISFEEKMEGIRKSIEEISAKQGIKPPVKRERHSPVISSKLPTKSSSPISHSMHGDWRARTAVARSVVNDDNKSYIRSYSTRRGRAMSFKQEEDEAVLAISGTPLSMRRKAAYSRNAVNKTSVYNKDRPQRVLLSPIKIQNTVSRQVE